MLKLKVSEISIEEPTVGSFHELELKSFIIKKDKDDSTTNSETIKGDHLVLMSESEYREKLISKSSRKSNPLLVNFEQYD